MSAPFAWDSDKNLASPPPAINRDGADHRRQIRDYLVRTVQRAFTGVFRPPSVLSFARADKSGSFTPAVNGAWEKVTGWSAVVVGDPIFNVASSRYDEIALTIDATTQNRYASALAGVKLENVGAATRFVEIGIGFDVAPVRFIHSLDLPAGQTRWVPVAMPRTEMTAPVSLWVKSSVAADLRVLADTWIALELGARWR